MYARRLPINTRNNFAYPAGRAPGINPNHVAFSGAGYSSLRFTGIATASTFIELGPVFGKLGVNASGINLAFGAYTTIGPSVNYGHLSSTYFPGINPNNDLQQVIAAIFMLQQYNGNTGGILQTAASTGAGGQGYTMAVTSTGALRWQLAAGSGNFSQTLGNFVPYFCAMSLSGTSQIGLLTNLATGQIITSSSAIAATPLPNASGVLVIGNTAGLGNGAQGADGYISAAACLNNFLTMKQLLVWGQDPWSFWYPDPLRSFVGAGLTLMGSQRRIFM